MLFNNVFFMMNKAGKIEEHTSELQSHHDLVCRLLLEKKNQLLIATSFVLYDLLSLSLSTHTRPLLLTCLLPIYLAICV